MTSAISVKDHGAIGDGRTDEAPAIQRALDSGAREVRVPAGIYLLDETLLLGSDMRLTVDSQATLRLAKGAGPRLGAGGFLLTNRDHASGNRNLTVEGGVWDGNNPGNPRGP
ncbi:MAG: endopolygalacturonase, partial [candidate division WS1 bacterium]|nr:endopolygalacturonase [candidate division WS1 bacterium]